MEAGEIRAMWERVEARIWDGMSVREKARWRKDVAARLRAAGIPDAEALEGIPDGPGHGEVLGLPGDGRLGEIPAQRDDPDAGAAARAA